MIFMSFYKHNLSNINIKDGKAIIVGWRGKNALKQRKLIAVRVIIENSSKKTEETVEDVDVTECLDEMGSLYIRKLVLLLKQDFNFSLESIFKVTKTKKFTTLCEEEGYGSTVELIP